MTKQMYEDYIKELKCKMRKLTIALIVASVLFVGMSILAFSTFEFTYESTNEEYIDVDQSAEGGENITQSADASKSKVVDGMYVICGTIILCVLIVVIGVCVHGKSKSKNNNSTSKNGQNNNP